MTKFLNFSNHNAKLHCSKYVDESHLQIIKKMAYTNKIKNLLTDNVLV